MFKFRMITFFVFLGLFALSFQIGAMSKVGYDEANNFSNDFLSVMNDTDGFGIFANNSMAALPMLIPGFGIPWGGYMAWSTGFGFAAIISTMPGLSDIQPLSILFLSPFGAIEIIAYSIAMSCSFHFVYNLIKKLKLKIEIKTILQSQIKPSFIGIGIVLALLLVAGFIEDYMIKLSQAA